MDDKWRQLEEALSGVFGRAKIRADGHEVTLQKGVNGEKLVVQVFVDGWIKGEWSRAENDSPVHPQARFWRPRRSRAWPLKQYKELKRVFGKKKADEMTAQRVIIFDPTWNSPRSLVLHLKKNFPDLELVSDD